MATSVFFDTTNDMAAINNKRWFSTSEPNFTVRTNIDTAVGLIYRSIYQHLIEYDERACLPNHWQIQMLLSVLSLLLVKSAAFSGINQKMLKGRRLVKFGDI